MVKTDIALPTQQWTGTISVLNQWAPSGYADASLTLQVIIGSSLGSSVGIYYIGPATLPPQQHEPDDPPPPGYEGIPGRWNGLGYEFEVRVSAPSEIPFWENKESLTVYVWLRDSWTQSFPNIPEDALIFLNNLPVSLELGATGVKLRMEIEEEAIYSNGGILAFVERKLNTTWYAEEGASAYAVATVGDEQISVSGPISGEIGDSFNVNITFEVDRFAASGEPYAACEDLYWNGVAVDFSKAILYNPGADPPDPSESEWGRTQTDADCYRIGPYNAGIAMWTENLGVGGGSVDQEWTGTVWAPVDVTFKAITHKHVDDVDYPDIEVEGTPIDWVYNKETESHTTIKHTWKNELTVYEQRKSWEFGWEWKKLEGLDQYVNVVRQWQKDYGEDVGDDDDPNLNAQACPLQIHPRNVSDLQGDPKEEWGTGITASHENEKQVIKPAGVDRPGNWSGSGGLTPQASSGELNDVWNVAAGSTAPAAIMGIKERKTARLARVVAQDPDLPSEMKHRNLIIVNRANMDVWSEDDPSYLDPADERYPEHIWHWMNYGYAKLRIKAPMSGTIRMTVDYKYPMISDPGYPTLEPGELTVNWLEKTAVYEGYVEKTPDTSDYSEVVFDLACPKEGDIAPRLYVVTKITIQLPPHSENLTWEFDDIYLLPSYVDSSWGVTMPPWYQMRAYDPWDFLADYTMFAGLVGGVKCFDIPYGWEEYERTERSLKGRRKWRSRNPEVYFMDHSRPLSELASDIRWQEGWQATYNDPEESAANKDEDGNKLFATFYWWDLLRSHEYTANPGDAIELKLCPIVRYWHIVAGIKHVIYYEKFFQGRIHGIVVKPDRSGRVRKDFTVKGYRRPSDATDWEEVDKASVDGHGRYRLGPYLEKGYDYKVSVNSNYITEVANARYSWIPGTGMVGPTGAIAATGPLTQMVHIAYTDAVEQTVKQLYTSPGDRWFVTHVAQVPYPQPQTIINAPAQGLALYHDMSRRLHLFTVEDGTIMHHESQDWGKTWTTQTMVVTINGQAVGAVLLSGVTSFLFVVDANNSLICYRSRDHFKTHYEGPWTVTTGADAVQPACYEANGKLYVYCFKDGTLYCYRSDDAGKTWVEVGSA